MTKIRMYRYKKDITQCELAKMLGVSQSTVTKWELGISYPMAKNLIKLAEIFECSIDELLKD